jgi:signal transduction histidine kinase
MELASDPSTVVVDPDEIDNALLNLAMNSRDAMPSGGSLKIETHDVTLDPGTAAGLPDAHAGEFVCLSVSDSGHGMTPEVLRRAVEPFFTTKEPGKGTGLGLSSVYGFASQSGGFVNVASETGKGTSVSIFLPRAA